MTIIGHVPGTVGPTMQMVSGTIPGSGDTMPKGMATPNYLCMLIQ